MIAKITTGSHLNGLLEYNEKKIEEDNSKAYVFDSNINNPTKKNIQQSIFALNGLSNRKDKNFHASLNFLIEDWEKLGDNKVKQMIKDYMSGIGFPEDHKYVAYYHGDKKHPHIHIVTSKIFENGEVLKDSYLFLNNKKLCRKLELDYNITPVDEQYKILKTERKLESNTIQNEKELIDILKKLENEYLKNKISQKELIDQSISYINGYIKPSDMQRLKTSLFKYGNIKIEETKKHKNGLIYYHSINAEKNVFESSGIKSSSINNKYTFNGLKNIFSENKKFKKKYSEEIGKEIDKIFYKYKTISTEDFIKELRKKNIKVNPNISKNKLKGFSFSYYGFDFKGQDLPSRKYTFGKIKDRFSEESNLSNKYISYIRYNPNRFMINHNNPASFIKDLKNYNLYPIITKDGIYLIPTEERENNDILYLDNDSHKIDNFNNVLSNLTEEQVQLINEHIEYFYEEVDEIEEFIDVEQNQNNIIEEINDILGGNYTQDVTSSKKKKKKKGNKKTAVRKRKL